MADKAALKIAAGVYLPPKASQPWRLGRLLRMEKELHIKAMTLAEGLSDMKASMKISQ